MGENNIIKALVVDDQEDIRDLMTRILEIYGVETISAEDAESALLAYLEETPNIIFSDYMMPGMDVTTFVRALRAINESLPIVMFSGYMDQMMTRLDELEIEPDYILEKPFSEKDIFIILKENFPKHNFSVKIDE
jgi:CheY-like chemotaxis protein